MARYTFDQAVEAVRQCARDIGEAPSAEAYSRWVVGKTNRPARRLLLQILADGLGDKAIKVREKRRRRPKERVSPQPSKRRPAFQAASWATVLVALGESPDAIEQRRKVAITQYTIQDCSDALRLCEAAIGRVPTTTDYESWQKAQNRAGMTYPGVLSVQRLCANGATQFGWLDTLKRCGLDASKYAKRRRKVSQSRHRTDEELIEVVQRCSAQIGDVPSTYAYFAWSKAPQNLVHLYPTDTTLRRRLAAGGAWDEVLTAAALDPQKKSATQNAAFASAQTTACISALQRFVLHFDGLPPSSIYIRWSQMKSDVPSYSSIMYWLGGQELAWETAVKNAGLADTRKISVQLAEARNGVLPSLPSLARCLQALEDFRREKGRFPSLSAYRAWSSNGCPEGTPDAAQVLGVLAPRTWDWSDVRSLGS